MGFQLQDRETPLGKPYSTASWFDESMTFVGVGLVFAGLVAGTDPFVHVGAMCLFVALVRLVIRRHRRFGLQATAGFVDTMMFTSASALILSCMIPSMIAEFVGFPIDVLSAIGGFACVFGPATLASVVVRGFVLAPRLADAELEAMNTRALDQLAGADVGAPLPLAARLTPLLYPRNAGRVEAAQAVAGVEDAIERIRGRPGFGTAAGEMHHDDEAMRIMTQQVATSIRIPGEMFEETPMTSETVARAAAALDRADVDRIRGANYGTIVIDDIEFDEEVEEPVPPQTRRVVILEDPE